MPASSDTSRPSWAKLLREFPAATRLLAAQLRREPSLARSGTRVPVIVVPGLLTSDVLTRPLRKALGASGHRTWGWGQGFNMGASPRKLEGLLQRIDRIFWATEEKVALVGWSLGGLYAREAAKRRPDKVATVVTLGTPISNGLRDNNAWTLYEGINDHDVDHPPVRVAPEEKPPMRTVAIWSTQDGIVAPASASGRPGTADEQIELHCPHNELVSHPEAVEAVLGVLSARA